MKERTRLFTNVHSAVLYNAISVSFSHFHTEQHQLLTWKQGSDPASWPGQSGGNLSVCVTHGALFSQHGTSVYAPDILPVNDLAFF